MSPALQAVHRATQRSASNVHLRLKQGLSSLRAIATVAPFIGFLGTLAGIVNAFKGNCGYRTPAYVCITGGLSEALVPAALGLFVGIAALVCHHFLSSNLSDLDREMELAGNCLLQQLSHLSPTFQPTMEAEERRMFGAKSPHELDLERKCLRLCRLVSAIAFVVASYLQAAYFLSVSSVNVLEAFVSASISNLLMMAFSCCVAYPVWVKILNRQRGALLALSSVLALSWAIVETVNHLYK